MNEDFRYYIAVGEEYIALTSQERIALKAVRTRGVGHVGRVALLVALRAIDIWLAPFDPHDDIVQTLLGIKKDIEDALPNATDYTP